MNKPNKLFKSKKRAAIAAVALVALAIMLVVSANITHNFDADSFANSIFESLFPSYTKNTGESSRQRTAIVSDQNEDSFSLRESLHGMEIPTDIIITRKNINSIESYSYKRKMLYSIDSTAYVYEDDLDFEKLLQHDTHVDFSGTEPKVLIFHTHSREAFADSREGHEEDTIVGVGDTLTQILSENYGIPVLHHKGVYDVVDGVEVRTGSYEIMEPDILAVLERFPSIEVMIDLHRDSVGVGKRLLTEINGKPTATIMFFNGICRLNKDGEPQELTHLPNPYLEDNLALSLKMKLLANELFPGFTRRNYIKPYRYSLHMRPNSLLIEVGADSNTVEEAKNAMIPLAELLAEAFKNGGSVD